MTAILVHRSGSLEGRRDNLEADRIRLGRKHDNDIVFSEDVVSSYHAEIRRKAGEYVLVDLDSSNGTFVNGRPVHRTRLRDRDLVEMGPDGPSFEFRTKTGDVLRARIVPISGSWEAGNIPIKLKPGTTLRLGRGPTNDLIVGRAPGSVVSSEHCEIRLEGNRCELEDLGSSNGTYLNGNKIRTARLRDGDRVELGKGGPQFELRWADQNHYKRKKNSARESRNMIEKLRRATRGGQVGERTMIYLRVAKDYYKRRRRPFVTALVVGSIMLAGIAFYAYYLRRQLERAQLENFYKIREYDLERRRAPENQREGIRAKQRQLERDYDEYLKKVDWYAKKSDQEKAVMSLARRLGESDLVVPEDFYRKVLEHVREWKSTARLSRAMEKGRKNNLIKRILQQLYKKDLPQEFLYIALEESDFDARRSGPETRFGIAKGLWQFIPGTAKYYGLELGPEQNRPVYDPSDHRHDEDRSTLVAAKYLSDLYSTEAAASGLLVIACYNYGPTRIEKRILDRVPNNPQERNFWNFYRKAWIPDQTRNYVMRIFSAALICENPTLFGFPADICDPEARKTGAVPVPYRSSDPVFPVTDPASSGRRG
jgi:pSer/pThr/pTyr-binding forkhead associated (FHA) protein